MRKYIAGNIIDDKVTFTNEAGAVVDPSFVDVNYTIQVGTSISGPYDISYTSLSAPAANQIARLSAGVYELWLDTTVMPGYWTWQWYGYGAAQILLPLSAVVYPSPILYPFED